MRSQACGLAEVIRSMWAITELSKCDSWTFGGCYYLCPIIAKRLSQEENMKKTWGFFLMKSDCHFLWFCLDGGYVFSCSIADSLGAVGRQGWFFFILPRDVGNLLA